MPEIGDALDRAIAADRALNARREAARRRLAEDAFNEAEVTRKHGQFAPKGQGQAAAAKSAARAATPKPKPAPERDKYGRTNEPGELSDLLAALPIRENPNLHNEATTRPTHIEIGPKFHQLPEEYKIAALTHEAAHFHKLDDWYLANHDDWDLANKSIHGNVNGQTTPGEVMVEGYSLLWHDPEFLTRTAPDLIPIIKQGAAAVGLPLPKPAADAEWNEQAHHRGQPGNPGQFGPGGATAGGGKSESGQQEKSGERDAPEPAHRDLIGSVEHRQQLSDEITQKYGLNPVEIRMNDLGGDFAIGTSGGPGAVNLNTQFFTPERVAKYGKEWDGMTVGASRDDPQKTAESIIAHEIGHSAVGQILGQGPVGTKRSKAVKEWMARWQHIQDVIQKHYDAQHTEGGSAISAYGQEDTSEFAAEAFAALRLGPTTHGWPENEAKAMANAKSLWDELFAIGIWKPKA